MKPLAELSTEAIGKRLREACADRSGPTAVVALPVLRQLLALPNCDVNYPNQNGKAAIHFACQLRSATDVLTLLIAAQEGDRVACAAPYYGAPLGDGAPDWSGLTAVVEGHMAEHDAHFPTQAVLAQGDDLRAMGRDVTFHVYDGTGHPFAMPTTRSHLANSWAERLRPMLSHAPNGYVVQLYVRRR